jgi:hypothetical protein
MPGQEPLQHFQDGMIGHANAYLDGAKRWETPYLNQP